MKYIFKKATFIDKKKAQVYGTHLRGLAQSRGKALAPADLVEDARRQSSPLHDYFEWNDSAAAEKYRQWQARYLLNHLEVNITYQSETRQSRAFISLDVQVEEENTQRYIPIDVVLKSPSLRQQMLQQALAEAELWQKRYEDLEELVDVFSSIKQTAKKIRTSTEIQSGA